MGKKKKILVALASVGHAQEIFNFAAELSVSLGAELIAVNIINERDVNSVRTISAMGYDVDGDHYVESVRAERQKALEDICSASQSPLPKVHTLIRVGDPTHEILEIIDQENVDMVVMGIKGRPDLEYLFVGSVAEKVFRRSPVPVLSFRDQANAERLRKRISG